jgi:competence protein ComEA
MQVSASILSWRTVMSKLFKSLLLAATLAFLTAGIVQAQAQKQAKEEPNSAPAPTPSASALKSKETGVIDINTATEKELATLPKIGDARAKAIVKGRPYNGKDDLVNRKILSEDTYNGIKDQIIAKQKPAAAEKKKQ